MLQGKEVCPAEGGDGAQGPLGGRRQGQHPTAHPAPGLSPARPTSAQRPAAAPHHLLALVSPAQVVEEQLQHGLTVEQPAPAGRRGRLGGGPGRPTPPSHHGRAWLVGAHRCRLTL